MPRPLALWPLLFSLLFLGMGGLYGGFAMLADPSGSLLGLTDVLPLLPVPDYILPGLFLFFVMGLVPLLLVYGLFVRPHWSWIQPFFCWSGYYWAWTGTLGLGMTLGVWLLVQGLLIGFSSGIQHVTAATGFFIILLALTPEIKNFYAGEGK